MNYRKTYQVLKTCLPALQLGIPAAPCHCAPCLVEYGMRSQCLPRAVTHVDSSV